MSAITAKASRKMKKYAVLTREPRCFLGSFDFSWEQRKFSDITFPAGEKNKDNLPLESYSITNEHGFVPQDEKFENGGTMREADKRMYYIVSPNSFAYNPARINVGSIGYQNIGKNVIVSSLYEVFKTSEDVDDRLLWHWFKSPDFQKLIMQLQEGGVRLYFYYDKLCMGEVSLPLLEEQRKIGKLFDTLDNLITLHQRKCANLCSPSQVVFSLLFATSTFSWEQRKLSEMCGTFEYGLNAAAKEFDGKNKYIRITDIDDASREFLLSDLSSPDICLDGMSKYLLSSGDIVFARTGASVGKTYIYRENDGIVYFAGFLIRAKVNQDNDAEFVFQSTLSPSYEKYIRITSQRSGQPGVNAQEYGEYDLFAPSKEEQQRIGHFLRGIDNLITLHQRECISFAGRADWLILTANKKRTTSSWEQRKLGELVDRVVRKNINNESTLPLTISAQYGLVDQITYFNNRVASRDVSNYYLVLNGEFAYNKSTSDGYPFGAVKRLDLYEKGVLSTLYIVFAPKKEQQIDSDYLTVFFDTDRWHKGVAERAAEGARNHGLLNISAEDFFDIDLSVPKDIVEQKQIGAFIRQLDNLITLHQRKPFLMKWRTSDANRNQANRLVL